MNKNEKFFVFGLILGLFFGFAIGYYTGLQSSKNEIRIQLR